MRFWLLFVLSLPLSSAHASWVTGTYSGPQGAREYLLSIPKISNGAPPGPRPLLLFLHGCNQSPEEFIGASRIAQIAEERGYFVLVPKQDTQHNPERCWNWFLPYHQFRGWGEEGLLADLTAQTARSYPIDPSRISVAGLSAGGAMASLLASCHPDLFSAAAIHSGMPFRAASDATHALWAVGHGSMLFPSWAGMLGYQCSGGLRRRMPLLLIQGLEDQRVVPINAQQLLQGFAAYNDWTDDGWANQSVNLDQPLLEQGQVTGGHAYSTQTYVFGGSPLLKSISVTGMGHAWSGGDPLFSRTDPKGPDFTRMMIDFFERDSK